MRRHWLHVPLLLVLGAAALYAVLRDYGDALPRGVRLLIAKFLQLPIFLDLIGSVFISLIAGPWVGTVTAVITSLITGSFSPEYFAFIPVAICNALVVGILAKMRKIGRAHV